MNKFFYVILIGLVALISCILCAYLFGHPLLYISIILLMVCTALAPILDA
eukprot:m.578629 g.578629  ORF g.578629 m.578629 type:complete len:50 (+) comp22308_c0_seq10:498-647(+)